MKTTILRYSVYSAIMICALFLTSWYLLEHLPRTTQEILGYASMIVSLSFVFFGIKYYRERENEGKISFKRGLTIGVLISLITAVVFGILDVIYVEVLNPEFMDNYYMESVQALEETLSGEALKTQLALLESQKEVFANPLFTFGIMAVTVFVIGFIISLISAWILQRK
ncbi:MAG: DUF4199 domain-containing protein [Bacteroidota bacterium]